MRRNVPALAVNRASISNSRRLALLGAFMGSAALLRLLGYQASTGSFVVYGLWIATALLYRALLRKVRRPATANALQAVAYCADISFLSAIFTVMGGGWWYGAVFHAFIVTFAFASLPRRLATIVTTYAVAAFVALVGAEAFGVIASGNYLGLPSVAGNFAFAATAGVLGVAIIVGSAVVQNTFVRIMRRSQERYRLLLQTAPDFIATIDRAHVIRAANESAQGFAAAYHVDAVGQELGRFVHPEDRAAVLECMEAAWAGQSRQLEMRLLPGDASADRMEARWMIGTFNPLREDGRITALLFVARDITQRKRDEEALRRSQEELRQSQKMDAVGRLAGGVAHDFNNVLTLISAYSEFLIQGVESGTARREDVQEIRDAAARASTLTNQLLAFSRKQVLEPRMVSVNSVVQGMEKMLGRLLATNITIETALDPGLELVHADPGQLEQVLLNLCVNARDAMPRGGLLAIETRNVSVDDLPLATTSPTPAPTTYVALTVRDTGDGMDEETCSRVFEPFFTTKPAGQGTGLGLSTVYGIVTQSGGKVTVASERGRGSAFTVYLPATEVSDEVGEHVVPVPPRETPRGTETVLVVEDGSALREVIARILGDIGYTVLSATDGEDGMAVASSHDGPIHLLLTDVVMPVFGGRELARQFLESRPSARVLFMSGYMAEEVLRDGLRPPVVGFLAKPFRPDQLARKVRDVLDARETHRAPPPDGALSVGRPRDELPV